MIEVLTAAGGAVQGQGDLRHGEDRGLPRPAGDRGHRAEADHRDAEVARSSAALLRESRECAFAPVVQSGFPYALSSAHVGR